MKLSYLWKGLPGHPIHPPLTDATIGIYTFATIAALADVTGISNNAATHGWWLALLAGLIFTVPTALTGLYTTTFQASQQDMKIVFTNIWGAKTTLDLSATPSSSPLLNLIPETTIAAFGVALFIWFVVNSVLKTKKISVHE